MESMLEVLEQQKNWKEFLKKTCRKNKISVEIASFFTPIKIKALFERLLKNYELKECKDSTNWAENELKAFHWILVVNSGLKDCLIEKFKNDDWDLMCGIFLNKDESILKYEAIKLVNEKITKNRNWNEEETLLLTQIIKENEFNNKWNDIARKLFQKSENRFFRSGKQCRERWLNHLDPSKKKGEWDEEEDKIIIKYIFNHGRRWSHISKELGSQRTEHMVKNRFKTLLIRQRKITPKISSESSLLKQVALRLFGEEEIFAEKEVHIANEKEIEMGDESEEMENEEENFDEKQEVRKTEVIIPQPQTEKQPKNHENEKHIEIEGRNEEELMKDPILPQIMEDCSKVIGSVSTPMSNYEMQQIYSPYYLSYRGVTPYLSPSPSMSYFVNPSFSSFDNAFTQNMFICPTFGSNQNDGQNNNNNFNQ